MRPFRLLFAACTLALSACAPVPVPRAVAQADEVSRSPAALEAKTYAAPAWAAAEKRRREAHAALEDGPAARAQFMAEEAIGLYEEAAALARVAKAMRIAQAAEAEAEGLETELAEVEGRTKIAAAEVDGLETRLRVARDAEAAAPAGPAAAGREAARRDAAKALLVQGRLLCGAARLLGAGAAPAAAAPSGSDMEDPTAPGVITRDLVQAETRLGELETALGAADKPTPIELATRTRAACLSVLTRTRRAAASAPAAPGAGGGSKGSADALLEELSAMGAKRGGFTPQRDERGVVVTIQNAFEGDAVRPGTKTLLEELDRVAAAHKEFAIAVVVHSERAVPRAEISRWDARAKKIAAAFASVPEPRRLALVAGDALPVSAAGAAKNARVEIVFVAPENL
jgi:hypothetical protein